MITPISETSVARENSVIPDRTPMETEIDVQLEKDLVQSFKLLADETRLRILFYLQSSGELHVTALCDRLKQSQPAVSHHLALMRVAGLIEARRDGKHNFYSIRKIHFYRLISEFFSAMKNDSSNDLRFEDFTISRED
ncbi:ArsR/SmtB family transcription factor [Rubinisphaera italica]|uniref:HTH-type transcriptional regulator KmtR n=2 Tax=Rubinisphaera TaxID=1649490 RepID=A0A5C5XFH2_9PLAN|nr:MULTISPECIES: metalloregulator ArsR/SmtB family transcription factor [Rubinisphaera]MBV08486.1 ArsR family transcriptional regulator [Rubinisphaera sp.]TWT61856.1 HTH-type transcriptional regulator KmtR [Rubinisphaera italica]HCS51442.1 ArsR family transcriptional regulator [Planctomycetaceae bacterium]